MRWLGRFLPPKQKKDQDTDDDHQDAADEDQPVWHTGYFAMMLHQEEGCRSQELIRLEAPCL